MNTPIISAIAAIGRKRELGKNNDLLWRIPADLGRVKTLTTGHPIIMGRKTYESIGRPLPNRTNIIITSDPSYLAEGCVVTHSLEAALKAARAVEETEIFIFGGATIYEAALPYTNKLYLTMIDATDAAADTFFPIYEDAFAVIDELPAAMTESGLTYQWVELVRI